MFDPSKMNPQMIAEISELMSALSPDQMMKMQSLMHNSMAGFNVTAEVAAFESSLPPNFREKMARLMYMANGIEVPPKSVNRSTAHVSSENDLIEKEPANANEARLVILHSVQNGMMSPNEALSVLFPANS